MCILRHERHSCVLIDRLLDTYLEHLQILRSTAHLSETGLDYAMFIPDSSMLIFRLLYYSVYLALPYACCWNPGGMPGGVNPGVPGGGKFCCGGPLKPGGKKP